MTLDYTIIKSGSKGNCVKIEDVIVDVGVPFSTIKPYLYRVNYILITHIHSDHLNKATVKKIRQLFPHIEIISHWQVAQHVDVDHIINAGYQLFTDEYTFNAFELKHDVECYGFYWEVDGQNVIYATDTNNLNNAPNDKFDYLFLESNHDLAKIRQTKPTRGYDPRLSALRHLSTFDSKQFYFTHRRDRDSEWIELHKSERFY